MTALESSDTVIAGITLLLVLPFLFLEVPSYRRDGYNAQFRNKTLEEKLDHIAAHPDSWTRMGGI